MNDTSEDVSECIGYSILTIIQDGCFRWKKRYIDGQGDDGREASQLGAFDSPFIRQIFIADGIQPDVSHSTPANLRAVWPKPSSWNLLHKEVTSGSVENRAECQ